MGRHKKIETVEADENEAKEHTISIRAYFDPDTDCWKTEVKLDARTRKLIEANTVRTGTKPYTVYSYAGESREGDNGYREATQGQKTRYLMKSAVFNALNSVSLDTNYLSLFFDTQRGKRVIAESSCKDNAVRLGEKIGAFLSKLEQGNREQKEEVQITLVFREKKTIDVVREQNVSGQGEGASPSS